MGEGKSAASNAEHRDSNRLRGDGVDWVPDRSTVAIGLDVLERLVDLGLVEVGHTEYVDGGPPGRAAPYRHVAVTMSEVRPRVEAVCRQATRWPDWAFSCSAVNTDQGDSAARHAL